MSCESACDTGPHIPGFKEPQVRRRCWGPDVFSQLLQISPPGRQASGHESGNDTCEGGGGPHYMTRAGATITISRSGARFLNIHMREADNSSINKTFFSTFQSMGGRADIYHQSQFNNDIFKNENLLDPRDATDSVK